jgi:hypothetical protein
MPARAFGAPHTTWIGSPDPVSTLHTRSCRLILDGFDLEPDACQRLGDRLERR